MTLTDIVPRTFRGPGGVGAPSLAGVAREEAGPSEVIETERFDTDDHRLAAAGITLVRYRDGDTDHWRLDLPDGDATEQLRVPAGATPGVPDELDELVRGASRRRALRPAGRIRTVRTETRLFDTTGDLLATVVHDEITLATLGRSTEIEAWTEVELRATGAGPTAAIEERIVESGLRPGARSGEAELDRLLVPSAPRPVAGRKGSAGRVLHRQLAEQVERLAAADLGVRRSRPDAVHQVRVAARRLRSILATYRPLLDRGRTDPLVGALRELGRELAPARDAEVLRERIAGGLAALDPALRLGPVQAQVTRHFARIEAEAHAAVLGALDGDAYTALRRDLDELVERPPLLERASRPARKELAPLVARCARRLDRAMAATADATDRDVAIHTARKAVKQLGYAAEVAGAAPRRLKGLQRHLGEHQDTVVTREALRELGAAADNGFAFGVLYASEAARAERIEADLPRLRAKVRHS